jgi:uncharacterized protein (TIGR03083 family)
MGTQDVWPTIHTERAALAADLEGLSDEQWSTPSTCGGWTVRDVLAHMTAAAVTTAPKFFSGLVSTGFKFNKLQDRNIARLRGESPRATLDGFKAQINSSKHPPGPNDTWLGETIVHAEDIRRPLEITHEYPAAAAAQVADSYKGSNLIIGAKRRIEGLHLQATDYDWSHGTGPDVAGPMVSLLIAMTGRKGVLDELTGDGVATLRSR